MKLCNFVAYGESIALNWKDVLTTLEYAGVITRWAFCFHDVKHGALNPHYHIYLEERNPKALETFLENIVGGHLLGDVRKEKDMLLYMMRHGKCDTANIVANFDVEKVINT